ncbi:MAG TPA: GNAT family N-acetyltransferase [Burkholderiaceae bacterium]|nr:GNAT family N-acetyltransferase [Burkholderiaceae bacterium]
MADITIRRVRISDAEGLAALMSDPEVFSGLLQLPHPSIEGWRTRLTEWDAPGRQELMLVAEAQSRIVGNAGLHPVSPALRRRHALGIGLSVATDWQRRGVGTRLMAELLDAADRWLGCLRIELEVYTDNAAAIALYRKFGFEHEGTHRAYALRDGRYVDTYSMARLHPNPPRIGA